MGADAASEPSKTAGGTSSSEETKSSGQRGQKTGFTGDGFTEQRDFSEECDSLLHDLTETYGGAEVEYVLC